VIITLPITRDWYAGANLTYTLQSVTDYAVLGGFAGVSMTDPDGNGCFCHLNTAVDTEWPPARVVFTDTAGLSESVPLFIPANMAQANSTQVELAPASGEAGDGDTAVDHNTGGADNLRTTLGGLGADNVRVVAYLQSDYLAGVREPNRGVTYTGPDGRWLTPLMLNSGQTYTLVFQVPGVTQADVVTLEVP
jgi:hypothetical protein